MNKLTKKQAIKALAAESVSARAAAARLLADGYFSDLEVARSAIRRARGNLRPMRPPAPEIPAKQFPVLYNFQRAISTGVVRLEPNNLVFERDLTTEETQGILAFLTLAHDASLFWFGAMLNKVREQKSKEFKIGGFDERGDPAFIDGARRHGEKFAREAAANSSDADTILEAMHVCESLGQSRFKLSWHHHREAVAECGRSNGRAAVEWLRQAEEHSWTPSEMRAAIRKANASEPERTGAAVRTLTIATEIRRLTSRVRDVALDCPVSQWSNAQASAFLDDCSPFLKIVNDVRERSKELNPEFVW